MNLSVLRKVAWAGLAAIVLIDASLSLRMQGGLVLGVVMLVVFSLAVAVAAFLLMPNAFAALFCNRDLLIPLVLVTIIYKLLAWLAAVPLIGSVLAPSISLRFLSFNFALSLSFLLQIAVAVAYATWMTGCLVALVQNQQSDPSRVLALVPGHYGRFLGFEFMGWAVTLGAVGVLALFMPIIGFIALVPLLVFAVAWNFATAAILPVAWLSESKFWPSFALGVRTSLNHLGKWWLLLLVQMLLLGLVFFYYSHSSGAGRTHTNVNWSVNAFWTGGYENDCRWYTKLAQALPTRKLPLVETLLGLLFGVFAVMIKIAIVQRWQPAMPPPHEVGNRNREQPPP